MLSIEDFNDLLKTRADGVVSMYMPTHRRGPEIEADPIRLKNLLAATERLIDSSSFDRTNILPRLDPVRRLLDDVEFWRRQGDGLALFVLPDGLRIHRLPVHVEELAFVSDRPCVRPLLPAISAGRTFYALALAQKQVRLLECTQSGAREIDLDDIPESLSDALGYDWEEKSLQFHTGAHAGSTEESGVFHGQGRGDDDSKDEIETFLKRVDSGLCRLLAGRPAPVVLAAVEYEMAMYRNISRYPELVEEGVPGNPEHLTEDELHAAALRCCEPVLQRARRQSLELLQEGEHTDLVCDGIDEVLPAVRDARVARLFVQSDRPIWGNYSEQSGKVDVHERRGDGDEDLADLAIALAAGAGAEIHPADEADLPDDAPIAAILRYASPEPVGA